MFSVNSLDKFEIEGQGTVFIIESPAEAERYHSQMMEALGGEIEIDGVSYIPIGFEWAVPATLVGVGEKIGVLVKT